jgi:hypothetical protein
VPYRFVQSWQANARTTSPDLRRFLRCSAAADEFFVFELLLCFTLVLLVVDATLGTYSSQLAERPAESGA